MLSVFHGTGSGLNALQVESHLTPPLAFKVGATLVAVFQRRELRVRE